MDFTVITDNYLFHDWATRPVGGVALTLFGLVSRVRANGRRGVERGELFAISSLRWLVRGYLVMRGVPLLMVIFGCIFIAASVPSNRCRKTGR